MTAPWMRVMTVLVLLAAARPASAQIDLSCPRERLQPDGQCMEEPRSFSVPIEVSIFAAAATADMVTTYQMVQTPGLEEKNPLLTWASGRPTVLVVVASAMTVGAGAAWHHAMRNHPKLRTAGWWVATGISGSLAIWNQHLITDRRRHAANAP